MDWVTAVEWGIAATIAIGAKREMGAFRTMFQSTLDKLVATQEAQGKDIAALKAQSARRSQGWPASSLARLSMTMTRSKTMATRGRVQSIR
jgi:hypothetical protein